MKLQFGDGPHALGGPTARSPQLPALPLSAAEAELPSDAQLKAIGSGSGGRASAPLPDLFRARLSPAQSRALKAARDAQILRGVAALQRELSELPPDSNIRSQTPRASELLKTIARSSIGPADGAERWEREMWIFAHEQGATHQQVAMELERIAARYPDRAEQILQLPSPGPYLERTILTGLLALG